MGVKTYRTKEIPELCFEIHDLVEVVSIEEQLKPIKQMLIDRINGNFEVLEISIKEDFFIRLTNKQKMHKDLILNHKPIDNK